MTEQELELKIRDYIKTLYNAEYNGILTVTKTENIYRFSIAIPSYMTLTSLAMETESEQEFLDYIYEELRTRNYVRVYFYKVTRTEDLTEE